MGVNRYVYADGDTSWYDTFVARVEKQSKGYNGVSLTEYNTTAVCQIAEGSSWEQAGGVCYTTADTAISGSVATGICYIYSTASTDVASISWNQNEPTWRDDYCGYYWSVGSTVRAIGAIYYHDSSYYLKTSFINQNTILKADYDSILMVHAGVWNSVSGMWNGFGYIDLASGFNSIGDLKIPHNSVIDSFFAATEDATVDCYITKCAIGSAWQTTIASIADASGGGTVTSSISYALVNKNTHTYILRLANNAPVLRSFYGAYIKYYYRS